MTYAFTYDVPINAETYDRIKQGLGPERPPGLIAHLAWRTESGLRYVYVRQSKDEWESFTGNRLHPVVHPILQDTLGFVPPEPPRTVLDVIDAWTDRTPADLPGGRHAGVCHSLDSVRLACHAVFAWAVGDPGHPAAIWRSAWSPWTVGPRCRSRCSSARGGRGYRWRSTGCRTRNRRSCSCGCVRSSATSRSRWRTSRRWPRV